MHRSFSLACSKDSATGFIDSICIRLLIFGALVLLCALSALPQNAEFQQKLAAAKQAAAEKTLAPEATALRLGERSAFRIEGVARRLRTKNVRRASVLHSG